MYVILVTRPVATAWAIAHGQDLTRYDWSGAYGLMPLPGALRTEAAAELLAEDIRQEVEEVLGAPVPESAVMVVNVHHVT